MKLRNVLGLAVTVPALVVTLAQPSTAASQGVVAFTGTFQIKPTSAGLPQTVKVCFSALPNCPDGLGSTGVAFGVGSAEAIDGLYAEVTYTERCAPGTVLPPASNAFAQFKVHDAVSGQWSQFVPAQLTRVGTALVIQGAGATGAAVLTPLGVPVCDAPLALGISGSAMLAY